jgi:catechol 2,3-dioxygenase-like lactoylglutathione lyase family enzyme
MTRGVHHIGLTVSRLEESAAFFLALPGWHLVRRDDDYPAIFVSDDHIMLTLWQVKEAAVAFDKNSNVGLHHLALEVESLSALESIHQALRDKDVPVEFAPELLRQGPARHMMCYEPSGIRIEFIWPGS